jgi:hypothetical protein
MLPGNNRFVAAKRLAVRPIDDQAGKPDFFRVRVQPVHSARDRLNVRRSDQIVVNDACALLRAPAPALFLR